VLKPHGKVILGVPFFYWLHEEPHDYYRFTKYKLQMFCEENRLAVVSLEPHGGAPEIILDIIAKNIAFSKTLSACHFFLSNVFAKSKIGKKISAATAQTFPFFYCVVAQKSAALAA
jgi:hypothetical protein